MRLHLVYFIAHYWFDPYINYIILKPQTHAFQVCDFQVVTTYGSILVSDNNKGCVGHNSGRILNFYIGKYTYPDLRDVRNYVTLLYI